MQIAGNLPGNLPGNLRGNLPVPCTFRRGLIAKIRQKFGKIWAKSSENLSNLAKFGEKISKIYFQRFLTKILSIENGAKECIV